MSDQRIGIIMNGVTGRMGTEPTPGPLYPRHSRAGRHRRWRDGIAPVCPIQSWSAATRAKLRADRRASTTSRAGPPTSPPRSPTRTTRLYFDAQLTDSPASRAVEAGRSPPASTCTAKSRIAADSGRAPCELASARHRCRRSSTAWCRTNSSCPACASSSAWSTAASSAGYFRYAESSATGSSRATGSPRSAPRGTTAGRTVAASSLDMFCALGVTSCDHTLRPRARGAVPRLPPPSRSAWDEHGQARYDADGRRHGLRHLRTRRRHHRAD